MTTKHGLEPVIRTDSRVLVLGTLPGGESLRLKQYYADPRNQFWQIVEAVTRTQLSSVYADRIEHLLKCGIALRDVLQSANREGSLDSAINSAVPNDLGSLFSQHGSLRLVVFNGTKAGTLFHRRIKPTLDKRVLSLLRFDKLPSTSPTPGRHVLDLNSKIEEWCQALRPFLHPGQ
jgi:TDG/mug DNA glycosylase family protein